MSRSIVILGVIALLATGCSGGEDTGPPVRVAPLRPGSTSGNPVAADQQPAPGQSFTVLATGDVLVHPELTGQAVADGGGGGRRDFVPLFADVASTVRAADLAICHLEVPLATKAGPFQDFPLFYAPPEVADALAETGYDTCSTASNHTFDHGPRGVRTTLDALDAAGIGHTGSARTRQEAARPLITDVNGVLVGQVSFTFGYNLGTSEPQPWMGNEIDVAAILAAAGAAKEAGADVVIASLHWGLEDQAQPSEDQRRIADALLADPAVDLIVGHHAHVVQPFDKLHGKWVAYGLGNQVAKHDEPRGTTEEGVMARFRFTRGPRGWAVDKAEYLPTLVDLGPPIRLMDLTRQISEVDPARRAQALARTDASVRALGAADDGLTRPER